MVGNSEVIVSATKLAACKPALPSGECSEHLVQLPFFADLTFSPQTRNFILFILNPSNLESEN